MQAVRLVARPLVLRRLTQQDVQRGFHLRRSGHLSETGDQRVHVASRERHQYALRQCQDENSSEAKCGHVTPNVFCWGGALPRRPRNRNGNARNR
jgi:hypothetical protein